MCVCATLFQILTYFSKAMCDFPSTASFCASLPSVLPDCQPSPEGEPAGRVSVLPALLPAAAGVGAACRSAGHLERSVPAAESQRRDGAGLQPASGTALPPYSGAGEERNL